MTKEGATKPVLSAIFVFTVSCMACGADVLRCDFASAVYPVSASGKGKFNGPLPRGCVENFTGWKPAEMRSEVMEKDGVRFMRFETLTGAGGQLCFPSLRFDFPGVYLIRIRGRLVSAQTLNFKLRQNGAPYRSYWQGEFPFSEWREMESIIRLGKDDGASARGLYMYTTRGTFDLALIEIVKIDEAAYRNRHRRPPSSQKRFLRRYRFPAGLPAGWTVNSPAGAACIDASVKADDGIAALGVTGGVSKVFSEPFQTNEPGADHVALFSYRASPGTKLRVSAVRDDRREIAAVTLDPAAEWKRGKLSFKPPADAAAFTLVFSGQGAFAIDRTDVTTKAAAADRGDEPTVTLYARDGEIARNTRVQFVDETPVLHGIATDVPAGARVVLRVTDLYGETAALEPVVFAEGGKTKSFTVRYDAFGKRPLGQFRVQARLVHGERKLSRIEEFVVTRIKRPVAWRRDAPDSPFGSHFLPLPERLDMVKACGVNWMRLHDAGTSLSGWWALEKERGRWNWPDADIARVRKAGIRIFAQLGTAPAWATHYYDLGCKRMGYFEKYLRPVDTAAWTNYVERYVSRYAGVIDDYFIWNEPWGEWWRDGKDIRYYDRDRAAEDFGAFSRLTYDAAKRANPSADICGINAAWGEPASNWTARVASGGGYAACDSMDFHVYARDKMMLRGEAPYSGKTFSHVRAAAPSDNKPVIMSEGQGAAYAPDGSRRHMGGLYSAAIPWKESSPGELADFSDRTCRYVVSLLTEKNLKRVFLYTTQGFSSLGQKPSYQTLLGADGYPHPSFAAFSQMASAIEGKRFVRRMNYGGLNGVRADFAGPGGTCRVYANLTEEEARELSRSARLVDLYGNRFDPDRFFKGTLVYETKEVVRR